MVGAAARVETEAKVSRSCPCFLSVCRLDFAIFHDDKSRLVDSIVDVNVKRSVPVESWDPSRFFYQQPAPGGIRGT